MSPSSQNLRRKTQGFSLVEIMVGMVIGLLGMIVIMQVFSVFEGQKRTTTGGSDVQNNGAIALFGLQQNIQQSGYGTATFNLASCNIALPSGGTVIAAPIVINPAAAVIPAGDPNTDTLLVTYGNSNNSTEGDTINTQPSQTIYAVVTPSAFNNNDYVVAETQIQPAPCNLSLDQVTAVNAGAATVTVSTGAAAMNMALGTLYDVGQTPKFLAYAIRGGNLTVCDYMVNDCGDATQTGNPAFWVQIANNIVSLRAEYGRDTLTAIPPPAAQTSYIVDTYDQTTPATACLWARAPVIRLVLVARNGQPDKAVVTTTAPVWAGSAITPINLTGTTVPANFSWQNYRYKVFQTTVPIRNTTMSSALALGAGC